jgi:hypothetical protein
VGKVTASVGAGVAAQPPPGNSQEKTLNKLKTKRTVEALAKQESRGEIGI